MDTVDNVCIKIELMKHSVYVLGLYRPPKVSNPLFTAFINDFEEKVQNILSIISPTDVLIIAGDLNVHCNSWYVNPSASKTFGTQVNNMLDSLGLEQVLDHLNYFRENYASFFDVLITNKPEVFNCSMVVSALGERCHHHPVVSTFNLQKVPKRITSRGFKF